MSNNRAIVNAIVQFKNMKGGQIYQTHFSALTVKIMENFGFPEKFCQHENCRIVPVKKLSVEILFPLKKISEAMIYRKYDNKHLNFL